MDIARGVFLGKLNEAAIGIATSDPTTKIEQSNAFIFEGPDLVTFNGGTMVKTANPLDFSAVVKATDLLKLIEKVPDEQIKVFLKNNEFRVKGVNRNYGITVEGGVTSPFAQVPRPLKWFDLPESTGAALQQAARTCDPSPEAPELTRVVHCLPKRVEACDNWRFFRVDGLTGFPAEILLPGKPLLGLKGAELSKVALTNGWAHFKTASGAVISLRGIVTDYHKDIDTLLDLSADAEAVTLPAAMAEIVERSEIFTTGENDAKVSIAVSNNQLTITARKENGWAEETKPLAYKGQPLNFKINPKFLVEMLGKTRDVTIGNGRMRMTAGKTNFVVALVPQDVSLGHNGQPPLEEGVFDSDDIPF
jgi:DNA polymerase III beta subunit, C-terminal domain